MATSGDPVETVRLRPPPGNITELGAWWVWWEADEVTYALR